MSDEKASSQVGASCFDVGGDIAVEEVTQVAAEVALSVALHFWDKACQLAAVGERREADKHCLQSVVCSEATIDAIGTVTTAWLACKVVSPT